VVAVFAIGIMFIVNGWPHGGRARAGWTAIGVGILSFGIGETIFQFGSTDLTADLFYLAGYVIEFTGMLLLPHISGRRWERLRLTIDSIAGAVSVAAIAWVTYLSGLIAAARDHGVDTVSALPFIYPLGDMALLVALVILATRRSAYQFDGRLIALAGSLILLVMGNGIYAVETAAGTYAPGGVAELIWLLAYAFGAFTTRILAYPARFREVADRPQQLWTMVAPYSAVAILFFLAARDIGRSVSFLQTAAAVVVCLIIARQAVAIREVREVVEKQRNDLVASISHELRTPLAAIGGFVEIMADDPDIDRSDRVEMVDMVRDQTRHLTRIVEDMIELSRDKLASSPIAHQPVDVTELVRSSLDLIPDLTLDVIIDVPLDLTMSGDESRLRQILVNYLVNASRYGGGAITIVGRLNGPEVLLEVHDNGPGVPKKHEITIWDRFERGSNTYLSAVQGSGLGLAIVRQLATAHDGTAGYRRSEILGGSCFWVSVPIR
jgi:signal transduction histidine kinase